MSAQLPSADDLDGLPENAVSLGRIALLAGLIRGDVVKCMAETEVETLISLMQQIADCSDTIRDTAADLAEALGCGPETVQAVRQGLGRIASFRACQGLEGRA